MNMKEVGPRMLVARQHHRTRDWSIGAVEVGTLVEGRIHVAADMHAPGEDTRYVLHSDRHMVPVHYYNLWVRYCNNIHQIREILALRVVVAGVMETNFDLLPEMNPAIHSSDYRRDAEAGNLPSTGNVALLEEEDSLETILDLLQFSGMVVVESVVDDVSHRVSLLIPLFLPHLYFCWHALEFSPDLQYRILSLALLLMLCLSLLYRPLSPPAEQWLSCSVLHLLKACSP